MTKQLKDLLPSLIRKEENWQFMLLQQWNSIVGNLGTHVCLEKIHNDTLILGVYDACWMQELYMLSGLLIDTINKNLDQPRIKHLRFKRIAPRAPKQVTSIPTTPLLKPIVLTPREQKALDGIHDAQLREALQHFLIRCYKEKKS
jgi:hypothetical protein